MQQNKGNKLFRQEALDRLASPEQLDQMMRVVNPRAWLPLTTVGFLVVAAATWSVFGRIPLKVDGQGILIRPRNVVQLQAIQDGQILTLDLKPGDRIKKGEIIGTIDQPQIRQQLEQERSKLAQLQTQNQETTKLQQQAIALKKQNLLKQRAVLNENLKTSIAFGPIVREKSLKSLQQKRANLTQSLARNQAMIPILEKRLEIRRRLREQKAIEEDLLLQAQQEFNDNITKVSDIEGQLEDLDRQESEAEAEYLSHLNSVKDLNTQIQDLEVQEAQLVEQDKEKSIEKKNQIEETRRKIAQLELDLAKKSKLVGQYNGRVLEVAAVPGQAINAGTRLASIETDNPKAKMVSVIYFDNKDGKQVKPGMTVQVTPSMVKRERYGGIVGKVTQVNPFPVTNEDIAAIVGNENIANSIAENVSGNGGAPVQVFAELQVDPTTASGYQWSSSLGPPLEISSGTTAEVRVQIAQLAPISYVIPMLRSLTGVY